MELDLPQQSAVPNQSNVPDRPQAQLSEQDGFNTT
jgi:hypothetical protein